VVNSTPWLFALCYLPYRVIVTPLPFPDSRREGMREGGQIAVNCCKSARLQFVAGKPVTVLSDQSWRDIGDSVMAKADLLPPELLFLTIHRPGPFVWQGISTVLVNQVGQGVTLRFRGLKVPTLEDCDLSDLDPLTGVGEPRKCGGECWRALLADLGAVAGLFIFLDTSYNSRHDCASLE
jgi:hypothetical protein